MMKLKQGVGGDPQEEVTGYAEKVRRKQHIFLGDVLPEYKLPFTTGPGTYRW